MKKTNDLKANVNENINNKKEDKKEEGSLKILKENIKIKEVKIEEVKIEEVENKVVTNIDKVDLEEVIEEIIIEKSIFETINNKIVDFVENKCLIIKGLNLISYLIKNCHNNKTISNNKIKSTLTIKENYGEMNKRISASKRREEVEKILDTKYKNKMDHIAREHTIELYVNDSTRFMVTL